MRRTTGCLILCLLALPLPAAAQPAPASGRGFISIHGGGQSGDGSSTQGGTFTVYDERGSFNAAQSFSGGGLLSISGGVRVWGNLAVGAAFTRVSDDQAGAVTVSAPHPLLFDAPRTASTDVTDLQHAERGIHLQVLYLLPVSEKFEVAVGGGPSFISVTHDFITGASFAETGAPFSSITVTNVSVTEAQETATGFNLGAEAAYYFTRNVGVGGFVRWTGATADLDAGGGTTVEVDLGGPQFGGGVRIRF